VTEEQFISLLDELGGEPAGWPAHLREGAKTVLAHSARARAALKAIQDVEQLLAYSAPAPAFDAAATAARATRRGQADRSIISPALRKVSFAALGAAALAAGIVVGMTPPSGSAIAGSVQTALNGGTGDVW
jgi:ferric-dicitrate binding protein FerR (iron transport regulator)